MNVLLLTLALLSSSSPSSSQIGDEIFIKSQATVSTDQLAEVIRPIGKLNLRTRYTRTYLVDLKPSIDREKAEEFLSHHPDIKVLSPQEEPVDINSLQSIHRKLEHLEADEPNPGINQAGRKRESGVDYLEAYQYMLNIRAFPNDTYDWNFVSKARAHARAMPVGKLQPDSRSGSRTAMQPWQFMGPTNLQIPPDMFCFGIGPTNGRLNAVAYDPKTPTTIYAGAGGGGLWKSTNGGSTWNWLSSSWSSLGVNCIAIDPTNTNNIYVGLGDYQGLTGGSSGLMISNDGGGSWSDAMPGTMVASILIDPTNSANIIIGTGGVGQYGSIYQSKTNGKSFKQVFTLPDADMPRFPTLAATHPKNGVTRFFGVAAGETKALSNSRVLYSDDNGKTWNNLVSPVLDRGNFHWAYSITTSPTDSNAVYALDSENNGLYTSPDQGKTWLDMSSKMPSGSDYKANYNFSQNNYCSSLFIVGNCI